MIQTKSLQDPVLFTTFGYTLKVWYYLQDLAILSHYLITILYKQNLQCVAVYLQEHWLRLVEPTGEVTLVRSGPQFLQEVEASVSWYVPIGHWLQELP